MLAPNPQAEALVCPAEETQETDDPSRNSSSWPCWLLHIRSLLPPLPFRSSRSYSGEVDAQSAAELEIEVK
jgi:hypothetical protein